MYGRFPHQSNRFGSPNQDLRPPTPGNEFYNSPRARFGNRESPRFPQDQSRMFSPHASQFQNMGSGSQTQQQHNNVNFQNPQLSNCNNFPLMNPHIPPPQMMENIPFHPSNHTLQQAPDSYTGNTTLQHQGMSNNSPGINTPEFLKMPPSQIGNLKWTQSVEEIKPKMQHPNAETIFPPAKFPGSGFHDGIQFPRNYPDDNLKNQMMFNSGNSNESQMNRGINKDQNKKLNRTKDESQEWVNRWLGQIGKSPAEQQTKSTLVSASSRTLKICEAQERVKQMVFLLAKLKQETAYLESLTYGSEEWKTHAEKAKQLQIELKQHQEVMTDKTLLSDLQQRVAKRRKKRLRQKDVRRERYEDKQNQMAEREELHQMIDNCQARLQKEEVNKKQEKDLKAAADSILSEVRKKIADAVKTIDLLKSLQKLRKLRKDRLSRQGITVPTGSDTKFEEQISEQIKTMQSQKEVYLAEEKTLKVMLEVEQEETKEKERELLLKIKKQKAEREERKMNTRMFGPSESMEEDDPVFPYFQYYDQANQTFEAFLQIRRDWDMFLVPEGTPGGSRIPDGFVLPSEPSSDAWATALKDE